MQHNANLISTAPLRKKNLYGEAMKRSKPSPKKKTHYGSVQNYMAKGGY